MSSSRIEAVPTRVLERAQRPPRSSVKQFLPRSLFGRAMVILLTPLILVQAVTAAFFYDRLWDTVMRRFADAVAGEIVMVIDIENDLRPGRDRSHLRALAQGATDLDFRVYAGRALPPEVEPTGQVERQLARALAARVAYPSRIVQSADPHFVRVLVALEHEVLDVRVPESRLWTSTSYIFLLWMAGTALVTVILASLFLRNQVRSLERLANAAEAFGKGRDVPEFRPSGASEVRQAGAAFLNMRERIQRQIAQRTEMLAGVSHDLRTPLTRMKLELELLGDTEDIAALRADVEEMRQMIEHYLDFARGEGTEQPQFIDLMPLLEGVATNARRDGAEIALAGPSQLYMAARPDALRRSIVNLVDNARRYGRHVVITAVPGRQGAEIIIDDDGPGIPVAERESVFRPFHRVETSRNLATGGIGLGLAIARDIIRGHGGDITLETSPAGGLRARVQLPG